MPVHSMESVLEAAAALEDLSRRRLALARDGQWKALMETEDERTRLAAGIQVDNLPADVAEKSDLAERLTRIRDLDQALLPLLEEARDALGEELRQVQKGVAGARAYEKVGDF
ncbi:hypothetical protein ECTPHS_03107 [Ectothiorhodospira sp. PHS-1]|uniref:flagellar protein FliT n=1 Tax=Ectothiorhodospira sp. PHS-1 TaxID=519989 RepID=UPI00024A841C|nr:flagellar protein FliT [Ectothiorhodospira sp. PHS-1]EHQ51652.1 hypothetical protein ECTPHS_03107 [Ectothiorhodospira sp. PHS-1]